MPLADNQPIVNDVRGEQFSTFSVRRTVVISGVTVAAVNGDRFLLVGAIQALVPPPI